MLILPVYFYVTRGKKIGLLIGLGCAILAAVVALLLRVAILAMLGLRIE
jgi:hypothetical protein